MLPRAIPCHALNLVFTQLLFGDSSSKRRSFPRGSLVGFCQKNPSPKEILIFGNCVQKLHLNNDLLRLEVVPRGKKACLMIQVSQEILASPAKRATESLGGWADKSSNRHKPSQVINRHKTLYFWKTNKQIKRNPTKEGSFSYVFIPLWNAIMNISSRSSTDPWRNIENKIDIAVLSGRPGF